MLRLAKSSYQNELLHELSNQLNEKRLLNCKLIFCDGIVECHAAMLQYYRVWWIDCSTSDMDEITVIFPEISVAEGSKFVNKIYSNVDFENFLLNEDCNNNSLEDINMLARQDKVVNLDTSLAPDPSDLDQSHGDRRQELLDGLLSTAKSCQNKFGEKTELVSDSNEEIKILCTMIEMVFVHGFKTASSSLDLVALKNVKDLVSGTTESGTGGVWRIVRTILNRQEFERLSGLKNITNDTERFRAWLRSALNEQSLEKYFYILLGDEIRLREFYEDWAFFRDKDKCSLLPSIASSLCSIRFAFNLDSPDIYGEEALGPGSSLSSFLPSSLNLKQSQEPSEIFANQSVAKIETKDAGKTTVCMFCGKDFENHTRLRNHVNRYHDETVLKCNICFKECRGKKTLKDHMRNHNQKQVKCNGCHEHFKERSFKSHQLHCLTIPPLVINQPRKCQMQGCDFVAETSSDLRKHMKRHKRLKEDHLCSFCDERFTNRKNLKAHMKKHVQFKCPDCDKSFRKQETLGRHRQKMHATIALRNSCGWFMPSTDQQESEVIPMEKFHHCELCQYKTKRSNNLKKHMAVHRNSKVIRETKCHDCGFQFKTHNGWKKHRERGCKMNLSGKVTVEDNIEMLNANQTTSQIKLNNKILRKSVGKKKVQSNIDKLLLKAKKAERKEWKCVKIKLWERNSSGKLVLVETMVSVVKNPAKYDL